MDPGDLIDAVEELKDLAKRPRRTIAKRTALVYGMVITATGTFCAPLYAEPSIVAPCDTPALETQMVATTSVSSVTAMSSIDSGYKFTT